MIKPNIKNEYGKLKSVLVCKPYFGMNPDEAVQAFDELNKIVNLMSAMGGEFMLGLNDNQIESAANGTSGPHAAGVITGHREFVKTMEKHGTEVVYSDIMDGLQGQMFTRDHVAVIGDKMLLCPNGDPEVDIMNWRGARPALTRMDEKNIILPPPFVKIEGGDIIIHGNTIFVGQNGSGTSRQGLEYLKDCFGDRYDVKGISMSSFHRLTGRPAVHLDTLFNPVSQDKALAFKEGIDDKSVHELEKHFELVPVNRSEQTALGVNTLSLGNDVVVSQKAHSRINTRLRKLGLTVEEIDIPIVANEGGAFRCMTAPLERE